MTNKEILQKAIKKAKDNGFKIDIFVRDDKYWEHCAREKLYWNILCRHDFAKAFWGEKLANCNMCGAGNIRDCCKKYNAGVIDRWKYYLQLMVLEEEPLKFIEKFL